MDLNYKKTVAITGASGFVGIHLVNYLKNKGIKTKIIELKKNNSPKTHNLNELSKLFDDVDTLINLVGKFKGSFDEQIDSNLLFLEKLIKIASEAKVKKIIHLSSINVYGSAQGDLVTEEDRPQPDTLYGLSKKFGEDLVSFYLQKFDINFIILRPSNIYGPGSDHGVIFDFLNSIYTENKLILHGGGDQRRDFIFIEDLLEAIFKSLFLDSKFEVFNLTTGDVKSLKEVSIMLRDITGKDFKKITSGEVKGSFNLSASNNKARRKLNWSPKISLEEGFLKTIQSLHK